jgi:hypothetical protein
MIPTFRRLAHVPPIENFRRLAHWPLPDFPVNGLYRTILGQFRENTCLRECEGETIGDVIEVSGMTNLRYPEARAVKTIVTNEGDQRVTIFEDGQEVGIVEPGDAYELPFGGKHPISADSAGSTVSIVTYLRCQCANYEPYQGYVAEVSPIGEFLL